MLHGSETIYFETIENVQTEQNNVALSSEDDGNDSESIKCDVQFQTAPSRIVKQSCALRHPFKKEVPRYLNSCSMCTSFVPQKRASGVRLKVNLFSKQIFD